MAQGLVGVGGTPRNISEIKVGVGGVRNVTEMYVGVNGYPRLAWAGDKYANKLFLLEKDLPVGYQPVLYYQVDISTLALILLNGDVGPLGIGVGNWGGGYKKGYTDGIASYSLHQVDMNTLTVSKYRTMSSSTWIANAYKGNVMVQVGNNNGFLLLDPVTGADVGVVTIYRLIGFATSGGEIGYSSTNSREAYATAYKLNCLVKYSDFSAQNIPVQTTGIPYSRTYWFPSFEAMCMTDSFAFLMKGQEVDRVRYQLLQKYDINTHAFVSSTTWPNWKSRAIFSPKRKS